MPSNMHVAVQGCSHGSLPAIYNSVAKYEEAKGNKVDLLLLCGDFQALRNEHDFHSLSVPAKFRALGGFHRYYSGKDVAPVLTIVIGGNHEASNYMWELYHGGWLAPNIYYLGAAGSVLVNGVRIAGASGIYKSHDYTRGHYEMVPYDSSALKSVYHIRMYDVMKLSQLSKKDYDVFMSHDWPVLITKHGDQKSLIRRKPFFAEEIRTDCLGSPPLQRLLDALQPSHWFAAHLHVKFAAVVDHTASVSSTNSATTSCPSAPQTQSNLRPNAQSAAAMQTNPDEVVIDDDEFDEPTQPAVQTNPDEVVIDEDFDEPPAHANPDEVLTDDADFDDLPVQAAPPPANPDEVVIDDNFDETADTAAGGIIENGADLQRPLDESVDLVEAAFAHGGQAEAEQVKEAQGNNDNVPEATEILVESAQADHDGSRRITKFLALDKCGPGKDFIQFFDLPTPIDDPILPPILQYDPEWLAITRALHPFLSLSRYQAPLPSPDIVHQLVEDEKTRLKEEGLLVPDPAGDLVVEHGLIDVTRVQKFWPTAPAHGEPGGGPAAWYTNPQTEAFCAMLGIEMKINPAPPPA